MLGGGHIFYCSRIRKNVIEKIRKKVTENRQTDTQTEHSITEATLIPWIAGMSGPTSGSSSPLQKFPKITLTPLILIQLS